MNVVDTLHAHILACGLFSRVLVAAPEEEFLNALGEGGLFREWPIPAVSPDTEQGLAALDAFFCAPGPWLVDAVRWDHAGLFIGPERPVALWESVWTTREGLVCDGPTFEVRRMFAAYGLAAPGAGREPDDHIAFEFAFLAHVLTLAARAFEDGDAVEGRSHVAAAQSFLAEHLGAWGPRCLESIAARAGTGYYTGLARLGMGLLAEMPQRLAGLLKTV